eukprot:TRINITY_DN7977_c0_g1_i2.p1 TRINITY_DN7977_c0_g1~~TRINITY_DN7977_c0_g1_i2.p1  ORF type:complete len:406 (-),score=66.68 TRINITY_DN7977_c0_g1_i2:308-1525(-)
MPATRKDGVPNTGRLAMSGNVLWPRNDAVRCARMFMGRVQRFVVSLNTQVDTTMNILAHLTASFRGQRTFPLIANRPVFGTPSFRVAGIDLALGLYLDIDMGVGITLTTSVQGNVTANGTIMHAIRYDSMNQGDVEVTLLRDNITVAGNINAHGHATITAGPVLGVRLSLLTFTRALHVSVTPNVRVSAVGQVPAFGALQGGAVPNSDALAWVNQNVCAQPHFVEFAAHLMANFSVTSQWLDSPLFEANNIQLLSLASGCLWPAITPLGKSQVTFHFETLNVVREWPDAVLATFMTMDLARLVNASIESIVVDITRGVESILAQVVFVDTDATLGSLLVSALRARLAPGPIAPQNSTFVLSSTLALQYASLDPPNEDMVSMAHAIHAMGPYMWYSVLVICLALCT